MSRGRLLMAVVLLGSCAKLYDGPLLTTTDAGAGGGAGANAVPGDAAGDTTIAVGSPSVADARGADARGDHPASSGSAGSGGSAGAPVDAHDAAPDAVAACPNGTCRLQATAVSVGETAACALMVDRTVWCWGSNVYGQLGNPDLVLDFSAVPVKVRGVENAIQVATGYQHACAVTADGTVQCWGYNRSGALGNDDTEYLPETIGNGGPASPEVRKKTVVTVEGARGAVGISAGIGTCALLASGSALCWGSNVAMPDPPRNGLLGVGSDQPSVLVPRPVVGLTGATALSMGRGHTCAVLRDGSVSCWGINGSGELGLGAAVGDLVTMPTRVPGVTGVSAIAVRLAATCALHTDGSVRCWGVNDVAPPGQSLPTRIPPTVITGFGKAVALEVSPFALHTCAVGADGSTRCWGRNDNGVFGIGPVSNPNPIFVEPVLSGFTGVKSISGNYYFMCAVAQEGVVRCAGSGQTIRNEDQLRQTPATVVGF